jgi:hypothetical protein
MTTIQDAFKAHELEARGLVRHTTTRMALYKEVESVWYGPRNLPVSQGEDAYDYMESLARQVVDYDTSGKKKGISLDRISEVEFFRVVPYQDEEVFAHITRFHHRYDGKKGYIRFDPMLKAQKEAVRKVTIQNNKAGSLKVLRRFIMGSETTKVTCGCCGRGVEDIPSRRSGKLRWLGQLHHMAFSNRQSLNKEGPDPSKLFSSTNFYEPEKFTRKVYTKLVDIMGCIVLCPSCHTEIHFDHEGDISDYEEHELPHALRSQANWNDFMAWLKTLEYPFTFPTFNDHINNQRLGC